MNPREFLDVAEHLVRIATPAACRTAVSRAYYAAFITASQRLRTIVPVSHGPGAHGEVPRCLDNSGNVELAACADDLSNLHHKRIRADYQMDRLDMERAVVAVAVILDARRVLQTIDDVFASSELPTISATIRTYWQSVLRKPL